MGCAFGFAATADLAVDLPVVELETEAEADMGAEVVAVVDRCFWDREALLDWKEERLPVVDVNIDAELFPKVGLEVDLDLDWYGTAVAEAAAAAEDLEAAAFSASSSRWSCSRCCCIRSFRCWCRGHRRLVLIRISLNANYLILCCFYIFLKHIDSVNA